MRFRKPWRASPRLLRKISGAALLLVLCASGVARASPIWTLWASTPNGVVAGTYPRLAISPETHQMFYSFANLPNNDTSTLGKVWQCDLNDPTHTFTQLPQTGLILPPHPAGQVQNVFSMTTDDLGEPIVGCSSLSDFNTSAKMFRFDKATNQWVAPTLIANPGQNIPELQPYEAMYTMTRGPNGMIWAGGQYAHIYRSTDNGKTFTVIDESALMAKSDPSYYPTHANGASDNGAIYSIRVAPSGVVYAGTESGGVIVSADNGTSWHPLDNNYTNPNSTLGRVSNLGNIAGLGFTRSGDIIVQGVPGSAASPPPDTTHLYRVDGTTNTVQTANGFAPYFFGGQQVSQIVTTANGTILFNSNVNATKADGTAGDGGIYSSTDGLNWTQSNTGINSAFYVPAISQWIDTNGHGAEGSLVVNGNDVYTATYDGNIWKYSDVPEPSSLALLLSSGAAFLLSSGSKTRRLRRRARNSTT